MKRSTLAVVVAVAAFLIVPATSGAATTVGAKLSGPPSGFDSGCAAGCTYANSVAGTGNPNPVASPVSGVVVRWRSWPGAGYGFDSARVLVLRPQSPGSTTLRTVGVGPLGPVAGSDTSAATTPLSPGIPIAVGDLIGLDVKDPDGNVASNTGGSPGAKSLFFEPPIPTDGSPKSGGQVDVITSVNADIEPDADHDGFGDETQDQCPTDPTTHGPCPKGGQTQTPPPLAALSSLAFSNKTFAAENSGPPATNSRKKKPPRGTKVSFRLNEAASVRFRVTRRAKGRKVKRGKKTVCRKPTRKNRKRKRCTRVVTLKGSFTRNGVAGKNSFHFSGRLRGRKLKPGRYRLVATPTARGIKGKATSTGFRIVR